VRAWSAWTASPTAPTGRRCAGARRHARTCPPHPARAVRIAGELPARKCRARFADDVPARAIETRETLAGAGPHRAAAVLAGGFEHLGDDLAGAVRRRCRRPPSGRARSGPGRRRYPPQSAGDPFLGRGLQQLVDCACSAGPAVSINVHCPSCRWPMPPPNEATQSEDAPAAVARFEQREDDRVAQRLGQRHGRRSGCRTGARGCRPRCLPRSPRNHPVRG